MSEPGFDPAILERLPVGILTIDREWRITVWNRSLALWTGLEARDLLGRDAREVLPRLAEPRYQARVASLFEGGPPVVFSYQLHKDLFPDAGGRGPRHARYCTASALPDQAGILFTVEDRTEVAELVREARSELARRREAERRLQSALAAQEMLVREASHRVKNNLAMIVSLIRLEMEKPANDHSRASLADLEARIESIGMIHELLYKGALGAEVPLDGYIRDLATRLVKTLAPEDGAIELVLELETLRREVDSTLYFGLILVELLTNALKYGRSADGSLKLTIGLRSIGDRIELSVGDCGPGFSAERAGSSDSLGWQLLEMTTTQLRGGIEILPGPGARISVWVPAAAPSRPQ